MAHTQVERLTDLLRVADLKIEDLETRVQTIAAEHQSPVHLQRRLIEVTHLRVELQAEYEKLKTDHLISTRDLQAAMEEIHVAHLETQHMREENDQLKN